MTSARSRWLVAGLIALIIIALGYAAYDQFLRGDEVAPLSLASPSPSAVTPDPASEAPSSLGPTPAASVGSAAPATSMAADLAGTWTVGSGSVAGYRVREKLANLPAQTDAVGRTKSITGQATVETTGDVARVTAATFEADLTTLTSDNDRRDRRLERSGIESARFPAATFELTGPVTVPPEALTGATVDVALGGNLTLHGVTKPVEIPAQARLADGTIEVAGSLAFPFSDFGIDPPNVAGFVSVDNTAELEFLVVLGKG